MFNIFKNNCEVHIDQMDKCLKKAFELYCRADSYLSGSGFGDEITLKMSARGAIGKGQKKIREAYWNFQDGVKSISSESDIIGLKTVLYRYTGSASLQALSILNNHVIIETWKKDIEFLETECKKLLNFENS